MRVLFIIQFLLMSLFASTTLASSTPERISLTKEELDSLKAHHQFTVCTYPSYFPLDGVYHGKLYGVSGDFYEIIEERLGIEIDAIKTKSASDLDDKVKSGECDMVSVVAVGQRRFANIQSSQSIMSDYFSIITKINRPFIQDLEDTQKQTLVVTKRSHRDHLKYLYPKMNIELVSDYRKAIDMLLHDEAYGILEASRLADSKIQKYGFGKFKVSGFLGKDKQYIKAAIGVSDKYPQLRSAINKVLSTITKEKREAMIHRWDTPIYIEQVSYALPWKAIGVFATLGIFATLFMIMLRRKNRRLHLLLNSTIEAIGIFENGRLIETNEISLTLYRYGSIKDVIGMSPYDFVPKYSHGRLRNILKQDNASYEIDMIRGDGTIFPALVKGTSTPEGLRISSVISLSKLKSVQKELENLNQSLETRIDIEIEKNKEQQILMLQQSRLAQMGEMISMIAHQWRQPLAAISSTSATINIKATLNALDNKSAIELSEKISSYSKHLSLTIDDFREFFSPNKEITQTTYCELVKDVLAIVEISIADKNIEIITDIDCDHVLNTHSNEVKQVLLNLIKNAEDVLLDRGVEKPTITISTQDELLIISDNAGGIAKSDIGSIFDPYFSTKKDKDGMGLGLYMSKTIIEEHCRGKLTVSNDEHGAVFKIQLGDLV